VRQRRGQRAEQAAGRYLRDRGWRPLAANVRVGRYEIDLIAVEPGERGESDTLVFVEVRSRSGAGFGAPEESVVGAKAFRVYRAALRVVAAGVLPDGSPVPRTRWRVDLVSVITDGANREIRHLQGLQPT
jgi:putative endonuclease